MIDDGLQSWKGRINKIMTPLKRETVTVTRRCARLSELSHGEYAGDIPEYYVERREQVWPGD